MIAIDHLENCFSNKLNIAEWRMAQRVCLEYQVFEDTKENEMSG